MKDKIALIGFMATGKSEVAKKLAKRLKRKSISLDWLIEKRMKKSIKRIFEEEGEEKFREVESEILDEVLRDKKKAVIDCGGGIILKEKNVKKLKEKTEIICLTASPEIILKRISKEKGKRPLLNLPHQIEEIKKLIRKRKKLYQKATDNFIDTSKLSLNEVVDKIERKLRENKKIILLAPPSKSCTNRALIIAALADGISTLKNPSLSEDVKYMISALRAFGVKIAKRNNALIVHGTNGKIKKPKKTIFVGNSGTTMRFITSFSTLAKGKVMIDGDERMRKRPIKDLVNALQDLGIKASSNGYPPVVINPSKFSGGKITLRGNNSSQYLSSILMSAPFADKDTEIEILGELTSKPYVDLTIEMMKKFRVKVEREGYRKFKVKAKEKYKAREITLEGDFSNSSYFFALAAISGKRVKVKNLNLKTKQGDIHFLDLLKEMGCQVRKGKNWVEVKGGKLKGIKVEMNDMPDLVQTLAVVALFASGKTKIFKVANLRIKETNRIKALVNELRKVGAKVKELEDGLIIMPSKKIKAQEIETYNDHRMAMSFGILSLINSKIKIKNPDCVKKSFPEFWKVMEKIKNEW